MKQNVHSIKIYANKYFPLSYIPICLPKYLFTFDLKEMHFSLSVHQVRHVSNYWYEMLNQSQIHRCILERTNYTWARSKKKKYVCAYMRNEWMNEWRDCFSIKFLMHKIASFKKVCELKILIALCKEKRTRAQTNHCKN